MKKQAREYWNNICANAEKGTIYQIIKAIGKRTRHSGSHFLLTDSAGDILDRKTQANAFVNHYKNSRILESVPYDLSTDETHWNKQITLLELNQAISQTKNTTPGEDGIPARIYKALTDANKNKLLGLLNESFESSNVPECWRSALILPIWKAGKPKTIPSSYRPIALTSVGCKIMERILLKRILDWTMTKRTFHERHFGFLPNSDSTKALNLFHVDINRYRKEGQYIIALKLDIHAAYDSIWRDGLIYKMANIGIAGKTALWIAKWIGSRKIKVKWRGVFSRLMHSYRGVPQGSVLSPILFMIFLWDLFEAVDSGVQVIVYADDILLYVSDFSLENAIRRLQNILNRLYEWCCHWKLELRPDKCAAINFSRRQDSPSGDLLLHGSPIPWVTSVKILGVIFSNNLSFKYHIGYLKQKCMKRLNLLKAIACPQWGVRTLNLIPLVNALVRSVIDYACQIYGCAPNSTLKHLDVIYNSALRFAMGLPRWTPIFKLYREANQAPLNFRRTFLTSSFHIRCTKATNFNCPVPSVLRDDFSWAIGQAIVTPLMLIASFWPFGCITDYCEIIIDKLPFQTKSLPPAIIRHYFDMYMAELYSNCRIIATDASKDEFKTSIAAVSVSDDTYRSHLVHHLNSVFTAEVLAIDLALKTFLITNHDYLIISDSKSALEALQNVSYKSPTVILHLFQTLLEKRNYANKLYLLWVPGHAGITPNERADRIAKTGPYAVNNYGGVAPEDLKRHLKQQLKDNSNRWWDTCKYADASQYLGPNIYKWTNNRKEDVFTARFRTQTAVTEYRLNKCKLNNSPTCSLCLAADGTEFHYIFNCRAFNAERDLLLEKMKLSTMPDDWDELWSAFNTNCFFFRAFLNLFLGSGHF